MKIEKNTKILKLIEDYPHLMEVLVNLHPEFKKLKNPVLRRTVGKFATLEHASEMSGIPYEELKRRITEAIIHQDPPTENRKTPVSPEERSERIATLKDIIRGLHEGKAVEEQKEVFSKLLQEVSASEIAEMEQSLIKEGISEKEIRKLCDVHVQIFAESFEGKEPEKVPPGHPVHTFRLENEALGEINDRIRFRLDTLDTPPDDKILKKWMTEMENLLESLSEIEKHYIKKENQLFPVLEKYEVTGPSKVMWAIHDDIRKLIKEFRRDLSDGNRDRVLENGKAMTTAIADMIYKEENILFPMALETLSDEDWSRVQHGCDEIGYALVQPGEDWKPVDGPLASAPPERKGMDEATVWLSTGGMTVKEIDLLLTHLPVDLTFVDADDRVQYYSSGKERIFPRSPGIIGREVQNCHPPDSVDVVEKILDAFKNGEKETAEFWIRMGELFIHIRYYAIRDDTGTYRGTLEVSQEVSGIKALEGERRLLDW